MIDLRSDTVTKPTITMRRAMERAEVGDDVYGEDPTVRKLEERVAGLMGKEEGLFVPTGTMGNQIAVYLHTSPGDEVVLDEMSHVYNFEMGSMAAISGTLPRPLPSARGLPALEAVEGAILAAVPYRSRTALISLENTHNLRGGIILDRRGCDAILDLADRRGLPVHLDGARIWNAAVATGRTEADLARGCASVMCCLSKGLGAPVGSVLTGSSDFIREARRVRKMLGGGMRQAGILAAAGLVGIEERSRLHEDHENGRRVAEALRDIRGIQMEPDGPDTNIIVFRTDGAIDPDRFTADLAGKGLLISRIRRKTFRIVTHRDVAAEQVSKAIDTIRSILR